VCGVKAPSTHPLPIQVNLTRVLADNLAPTARFWRDEVGGGLIVAASHCQSSDKTATACITLPEEGL
jgi:hypothetical protein